MTPDRWDRLAALFEGALALAPVERDAFVREHCPDPGIAAEIRALLAAQVEGVGPVERVMAALDISAATVKRHWELARVWLGMHLKAAER